MERGVDIIRRHNLDAEANLIQCGTDGEPAFGYRPVHNLKKIQGARGEVGGRHEGDVAAVRGFVYLVGPAAEGHVLYVAAARRLVEVLIPDHDLSAIRCGDPVDPNIVSEVVDTDVWTRLGESA